MPSDLDALRERLLGHLDLEDIVPARSRVRGYQQGVDAVLAALVPNGEKWSPDINKIVTVFRIAAPIPQEDRP